MDSRKIIYDKIASTILEAYPACYVAQVREIAPKQIPCAFITQISKARVWRYSTLANDDEQARLGFEAEVYASNINTAYSMMEVIENRFKSLGFLQISCDLLESGDPTIQRIVARFNGISTQAVYDPYGTLDTQQSADQQQGE